MSLYSDYLTQIENRKKDGLKPKPIEEKVELTDPKDLPIYF